jgi:hypothetical protein
MRADIHDGPEYMLQSETEYIDARPTSASADQKPLAPRGRTIHWVKSGKVQTEQMFSGLHLKADARRSREMNRSHPAMQRVKHSFA